MALSYSTNTYAGIAARDFIADTVLQGATISGGHITVHPAVKGTEVIQTIATDAVFQARADAFSSSGTTTVSERTLALTNLMVNEQIGITALLSTWQSMNQADSANDKDLPTNMADFLISQKAAIISKQIDELIWRGDTTLSSNTIRKWHNGIMTLALADSDVTKYATTTGAMTFTAVTVGATTALTSAAAHNLNVGDKLTLFNFAGTDAADLNSLTFTVLTIPTTTTMTIDAVTTGHTITTNSNAARGQMINTSNVLTNFANAYRVSREQDRSSADFRFYVPRHVADAYIDASLAVSTGQGNNYEKAGNLVYKDKIIVPCDYFPENTILTTRVSNLHFGTDLLSDMNEIKAIYLNDTTGDDVYRFIAKFASSVNYGFAEQMKIYRPA